MEACSCSQGRPKRVEGAEMVLSGIKYQQYLCCTSDGTPGLATGDYSWAESQSLPELSCSSDYCTSPGVDNKPDCWAGSKHEPCTCSRGQAVETGNHLSYQGTRYYEYTCCSGATSDDLYDGEECGDFEGVGGLAAVVFILLIVGCGCGSCICTATAAWFLYQRWKMHRTTSTHVPAIVSGTVVEMTATPLAPQAHYAKDADGREYAFLPAQASASP